MKKIEIKKFKTAPDLAKMIEEGHKVHAMANGKIQSYERHTPQPEDYSNLDDFMEVAENHINSIRFSNLDDTVTTMYPLIQPTMEEIADLICQTQSLENISYSSDNPYTSQIIINAIDDALKKAITTR